MRCFTGAVGREILIGRSHACDFVLNTTSSQFSRKHLKITCDVHGTAWAENLGKQLAAHVRVNNQGNLPPGQPFPLSVGDVITFHEEDVEVESFRYQAASCSKHDAPAVAIDSELNQWPKNGATPITRQDGDPSKDLTEAHHTAPRASVHPIFEFPEYPTQPKVDASADAMDPPAYPEFVVPEAQPATGFTASASALVKRAPAPAPPPPPPLPKPGAFAKKAPPAPAAASALPKPPGKREQPVAPAAHSDSTFSGAGFVAELANAVKRKQDAGAQALAAPAGQQLASSAFEPIAAELQKARAALRKRSQPASDGHDAAPAAAEHPALAPQQSPEWAYSPTIALAAQAGQPPAGAQHVADEALTSQSRQAAAVTCSQPSSAVGSGMRSVPAEVAVAVASPGAQDYPKTMPLEDLMQQITQQNLTQVQQHSDIARDGIDRTPVHSGVREKSQLSELPTPPPMFDGSAQPTALPVLSGVLAAATPQPLPEAHTGLGTAAVDVPPAAAIAPGAGLPAVTPVSRTAVASHAEQEALGGEAAAGAPAESVLTPQQQAAYHAPAPGKSIPAAASVASARVAASPVQAQIPSATSMRRSIALAPAASALHCPASARAGLLPLTPVSAASTAATGASVEHTRQPPPSTHSASAPALRTTALQRMSASCSTPAPRSASVPARTSRPAITPEAVRKELNELRIDNGRLHAALNALQQLHPEFCHPDLLERPIDFVNVLREQRAAERIAAQRAAALQAAAATAETVQPAAGKRVVKLPAPRSGIGLGMGKGLVRGADTPSAITLSASAAAYEMTPASITQSVQEPTASTLTKGAMRMQGVDTAPPAAEPAALVGRPLWRFTPTRGWLRGVVARYMPETRKHCVLYNAGSELEFQEALDVTSVAHAVSWRDPEALVAAPIATPSVAGTPEAASAAAASCTQSATSHDVEISFADVARHGQENASSPGALMPPFNAAAGVTPQLGAGAQHTPTRAADEQPLLTPGGLLTRGRLTPFDLIAGLLRSPAAAALGDELREPLTEVLEAARHSVAATPTRTVEDVAAAAAERSEDSARDGSFTFEQPVMQHMPAHNAPVDPLQCVEMLSSLVAAQSEADISVEQRAPLEGVLARARAALTPVPEASTPTMPSLQPGARAPENTPVDGVAAARQPSPLGALVAQKSSPELQAPQNTPMAGLSEARHPSPLALSGLTGSVSAAGQHVPSQRAPRQSALRTSSRTSGSKMSKKSVAIASPVMTHIPEDDAMSCAAIASAGAGTPQPWQVQQHAGSTPYATRTTEHTNDRGVNVTSDAGATPCLGTQLADSDSGAAVRDVPAPADAPLAFSPGAALDSPACTETRQVAGGATGADGAPPVNSTPRVRVGVTADSGDGVAVAFSVKPTPLAAHVRSPSLAPVSQRAATDSPGDKGIASVPQRSVGCEENHDQPSGADEEDPAEGTGTDAAVTAHTESSDRSDAADPDADVDRVAAGHNAVADGAKAQRGRGRAAAEAQCAQESAGSPVATEDTTASTRARRKHTRAAAHVSGATSRSDCRARAVRATAAASQAAASEDAGPSAGQRSVHAEDAGDDDHVAAATASNARTRRGTRRAPRASGDSQSFSGAGTRRAKRAVTVAEPTNFTDAKEPLADVASALPEAGQQRRATRAHRATRATSEQTSPIVVGSDDEAAGACSVAAPPASRKRATRAAGLPSEPLAPVAADGQDSVVEAAGVAEATPAKKRATRKGAATVHSPGESDVGAPVSVVATPKPRRATRATSNSTVTAGGADDGHAVDSATLTKATRRAARANRTPASGSRGGVVAAKEGIVCSDSDGPARSTRSGRCKRGASTDVGDSAASQPRRDRSSKKSASGRQLVENVDPDVDGIMRNKFTAVLTPIAEGSRPSLANAESAGAGAGERKRPLASIQEAPVTRRTRARASTSR